MSRQPEIQDPLPATSGRRLALFLDVDGTLLDIAPLPEAVKVPPELRETLASLFESLGGALAIVSGRSVSHIDQLFNPLVLPASGEHGFEVRRIPGAEIERLQPPATLSLIRPNVIELTKRMLGVLPEFKTGTIALHFRQVPALETPLRRALDELLDPYTQDFVVQPGKMVFEIKPRNIDKGRAIAQLMMAPPFEGRWPVFAGDDVTDAYGFEAVRKLGGHTIGVGPSHAPADAHLDSPSDLRAWLRRLAASIASAAA